MIKPQRVVQKCSRCGAIPQLPGAHFCGHCGAKLFRPIRRLHTPPRIEWRGRPALSCPDCGAPMRFGFRKICRQCGARLCLVPMMFHPSHVRVYVKGPRAALAMMLSDVVWIAMVIGALAILGGAFK